MTMKPLTITPAMRAKWRVINAARVAEGKLKLNFPLWVKVRNRIAAVPESYDQSVYKARSSVAPCGTVACLAGEAVICSRPSMKKGLMLLRRTHINSIADKAVELLGIDDSGWYGEAEMFNGNGNGWPMPFAQRYDAATTDLQRARVAVAYLTSVIRTGRVVD